MNAKKICEILRLWMEKPLGHVPVGPPHIAIQAVPLKCPHCEAKQKLVEQGKIKEDRLRITIVIGGHLYVIFFVAPEIEAAKMKLATLVCDGKIPLLLAKYAIRTICAMVYTGEKTACLFCIEKDKLLP